MIFLPPRAGKSMIASQFFPAWFLGRHPDRYVITASYGQELANDFGRKVRNLMVDPLHRGIFPGGALADACPKRMPVAIGLNSFFHFRFA
jgi:hypothetical protein